MKKIATLALITSAIVLPGQSAVTDNLVAYWDFEGGVANHASATGGIAFNGILSGNASTGGTPRVGTGALLLDGSGDYLDVTSNVNVNQPWAVSAWFRTTVASSGSARQMVYESVGNPTTGGYTMSYGLREGSPTTSTAFQLFCDNTAPTADVSASEQVPDASTTNTWHHILTVFTPATATEAGSLIGFLNGVQEYNLVIPVNTTVVAAEGFHIGTFRGATDRWFNGSIDEVAIWDRALTLSEAQEVYARGNAGDSLTSVKINVALSASPPTSGTVSGSGLYNQNAEVPISVTPSPGYVFESWDGSFVGQPGSFTFTASADATATAFFTEDLADPDSDGLTNFQEIIIYQTNPNLADTDGDEIPDGDEINITSTSPTVSDALLVDFVRENLSPSSAGAIALTTPRISLNPETGAVTLLMSLMGSEDQSIWQAIDLSDPAVSIVPTVDGWNVTFPAPSESVNSYILLGEQP
jgi:hypothetical protein